MSAPNQSPPVRSLQPGELTQTPSFTTASPGFLSRLGSVTHPVGSNNALSSLISDVPEGDDARDDDSVISETPNDNTHVPVTLANLPKPVKADKKKKQKCKCPSGHVLVYDPAHGYHYATLADSIPEGVSTDIPAGTERPEPTGATDDVEAEASSRSSSESDIEAAEKPEESPERRQKKLQKKALKKAKKEAKKEAKRLRKEQEALSQEALEGLRGMQLTSSKEQPEGALAAMETAALAQAAGDRKAALPLPGQVNVSGLKGKAAREEAYERELAKLQVELVKLQAWIKQKGLKVVVLFEGRDAAGKGGVIKRITERLNPRICRVCALGTASERERSQWYFQRYVAQLPGAGEMVLFDRSWYNRGGVERVMDFCSEEEYAEFMNSCPIFEDMLIRSGIILIKYWFSVSDDVQEKRFQGRIADSTKRWKLSPMDVESRNRWVEYSKAKDEMLKYTDTDSAPWIHVHADSKKLARLNCISHLLSTIPYQDLTPPPTILPPRKHCQDYVRPPMTAMKWVQNKYI